MTDPSRTEILLVEDDVDTQNSLRDILELDDYQVRTASSLAEALQAKDWQRFAAIILDRQLRDGLADSLLPQLKANAPEAAVIVITAYSDLDGALTALRQGAADYLLKPVRPDALRASLRRIIEQRRLKEEAQRSEAAFRNLVEAAGSMIVILRPDHTIAYFNPFAEELTGYSAREVRGRDFFEIFLPESDRAPIAETVERLLNGEQIRGYENAILCRDGSLRYIVWNATRLDDYEGMPGVLAVGHDITELKQAQERALQAQRLAAIGEAITGLAHESRNALQRSQASLEMLARRLKGNPELMELLHRVQKAQDDLHRLYEEVREYAAPVRFAFQDCRLDTLVREAWLQLRHQWRDRDAKFEITGAAQEAHCQVDPFAIRQVVRNILENALAACTDPVRIEARFSAAALDGRPAVRLALRNNGPPLTAEQKLRMFDAFYSTKTHGTGLGMAISKRFVEQHSGRIEVGPAVGCGAEIVITLPRQQP